MRRPNTSLIGTGSGESGKSTIVKQMKIIHQNGYTVEELAMYRLTIYKNLVDCAKALVGALRQFDIQPESAVNRVCRNWYLRKDGDTHVIPGICGFHHGLPG